MVPTGWRLICYGWPTAMGLGCLPFLPGGRHPSGADLLDPRSLPVTIGYVFNVPVLMISISEQRRARAGFATIAGVKVLRGAAKSALWIICLAGLGLVQAEERVRLGDVPPGEVLMIVEPHHDDHSWQWGFAGLVSRMIDEGYRGYFVRVSNDEKDGPHGYPHNDMVNLREAQTAVAHLGINDVISLNWRNDYMDPTPIKELRAQLILLIRKLRPDAVMSWDPWGHYDRNPDHRKVGRAVAEAVWMAGYANIHSEHLKLGVKPHRVPHVYFTHRGDYGKGHEPNIAVEHSRDHVTRKAEGLWAHRNIYFRPEGARAMREELKARGLTVPDLDGLSDAEAIERIEKWYMYWSSARYGRESGVEYAEVFYYLGEWDHLPGLKQYISENAIGPPAAKR